MRALWQERIVTTPAEAEGCGKPRAGLSIGVLDERAELAPSCRAVEQHGLAVAHAAESRHERNAHCVGAGEKVVELVKGKKKTSGF